MESREGYKKTELGWIPEDWNVVKFGNLFDERKESNVGELPLLAVTNSNGIVFRDTLKKRDTSPTDKSKYKAVYPDDIAYNTMRLWQGVSALSPYKGIVSPAYTVIKPKEGVFPPFYKYLMKTKWMIGWFLRFSSGICSDTNNCKYQAFKKIPSVCPPLPEQQKIAEILTTVDDKISSIEERIQQTEQLKKGLMEKLLTEGIGHTEFKDTEIGRMPANWSVVKLQSLLDKKIILKHIDGNHGSLYPRSSEFISEGIPYIGANCIINGRISLEKAKYLSEERASAFRKGVAHNGDVVFASNATVGPVSLLELPYEYTILSTTLTLFRCDLDKLSNRYLLFYLSSPLFINQYHPIIRQTTRNQLPITTQRKLDIVIPPLLEQKQIATILSTVDEKLDFLQSKKTAYDTLKKGLMDQLLTGERRVKV